MRGRATAAVSCSGWGSPRDKGLPMPFQPIVTWIVPCSPRNVQVFSTRRRCHTIGMIPSSQTLTCTTLATATMGGAASGSASGLGCFEGRDTSQPCRACTDSVAGTTRFLMVPDRMNRGDATATAGFRPLPKP